MNEPPLNENSSVRSQLKLSRAVRCALASIVLGLSYPNILFSTSIPKFQQIYHDMLGDKPLPSSTIFMVRHQMIFASSSLLFPIIAVALVFWRQAIISLYCSSLTILLFFLLFYFEWHALSAPLIEIVDGMAGSGR